MDNERALPASRLPALVDYALEDGRMAPGPVALGAARQRYVCLAGMEFYAARVAWALVNGRWPPCAVRFRDGDARNLRYANLGLTRTDAGRVERTMRRGGKRL